MKKEDVLNLMTDLPPDLIEEADFDAPAKRRLPRAARAGLIAACLCLALIGTAAAVNQFGVRFVDEDNGFTSVRGGVAYIPYDSLSDKIKALEIKPYHLEVFNSWQEAEDFVGVNLMDNPVLDNAPADLFYDKRDGKVGKFFMYICPDLSHVTTYGLFELGDVNIILDSYLYTDRMTDLWPELDDTLFGLKFPENAEVSQDVYTTSNGLTAQIMEAYTPRAGSSDSFYSLGVVSLNGIPTAVKCMSDNSMEEAHTALIQILDGFIVQQPL